MLVRRNEQKHGESGERDLIGRWKGDSQPLSRQAGSELKERRQTLSRDLVADDGYKCNLGEYSDASPQELRVAPNGNVFWRRGSTAHRNIRLNSLCREGPIAWGVQLGRRP